LALGIELTKLRIDQERIKDFAQATGKEAPPGRASWGEKWSSSTAVVRSREAGLDDTLSETFPCSDPLSSIPDPAKAQ
jgi:hypothetical protein